MRKFTYTIVSLLLMAVAINHTSCTMRSTGNEGRVQFDSVVFRQHIPLLAEYDSLLPYSEMDIVYKYPNHLKGSEQLDELQQIFTGTFFGDVSLDEFSPQEALDLFVENYTEEYQSLSNQYYEDMSRLEGEHAPMWYWYSLYMSNDIHYQNDHFISYSVTVYEYTGGAHGGTSMINTTVDLESMLTLTEEDIFVPNFQHRLADIIVSQLMKEHNLTQREELIEIGFFNVDEIYPNNNFRLDEEGLYYTFNQYEIAPYVMGIIDVFIPYEELLEILKVESVITQFYKPQP